MPDFLSEYLRRTNLYNCEGQPVEGEFKGSFTIYDKYRDERNRLFGELNNLVFQFQEARGEH